jgi:hypothetical protein
MLLLVFGFKNCEIVLLHLKAILILVCLKGFVNFLICGDTYVKVIHLVLILDFVSGVVWLFFVVFVVSIYQDVSWEIVALCDL